MRHVIPVASLFCILAMSAQWATAQESESTTTTTRTMRTTEGTAKVLGLKWGSKNVNFDIPVLETETKDVTVTGYRGVDDFFTVREANANIMAGQWQFELGMHWSTFASGNRRDDLFTLTPSLKYAITDDFNIEVGLLPINMGDGTGLGISHDNDNFWNGGNGSNNNGDWGWGFDDSQADNGNGDTSMKLYWQFLHEHDLVPAMAAWLEARFPTGDGSAETDLTLHMNVTKTLADGVRGHLQGFIKTANGSRGDWDRSWQFGDRRDFQCGAGTGFDFAVTDNDLFLINYMNRSSDYTGNNRLNSYELGWVHRLDDRNELALLGNFTDTKAESETGRWTAAVQWSIAF